MTGADVAERFEEVNAQAVAYVLGPARAHWHDVTEAEGWPVGVAARHIALGHELVRGWVQAIQRNEPIGGLEDIDAVNAEHAARGVVASPEEVAAILEHNGRALADELRSLSESDLSREVHFGERLLSASLVAEASLRHVRAHMESIERVVDASHETG